MLIELARDARANAYAPYSNFSVGAACRGGSGKTYFGCNVENASFPAGICAERVAVSSAVAHGERIISALALAAGPTGCDPAADATPCGVCLQFMSEFMDPEGKILIADGVDKYTEYSFKELLPYAFKLENSERKACHD